MTTYLTDPGELQALLRVSLFQVFHWAARRQCCEDGLAVDSPSESPPSPPFHYAFEDVDRWLRFGVAGSILHDFFLDAFQNHRNIHGRVPRILNQSILDDFLAVSPRLNLVSDAVDGQQ